jgi:hypothetical protein
VALQPQRIGTTKKPLGKGIPRPVSGVVFSQRACPVVNANQRSVAVVYSILSGSHLRLDNRLRGTVVHASSTLACSPLLSSTPLRRVADDLL